MGGPSAGGSRILDNSTFFEPGVAVKNDHDGSTHEWSVTLGAFIPSRMNIEDLVRSLRVRYELIDAASDDPKLSAWYSLGRPASASLWGSSLWGTATWSTADQIGRAFRSIGPSAALRLRTVEMKSRPSGKE
jgi:hypothetical protein